MMLPRDLPCLCCDPTTACHHATLAMLPICSEVSEEFQQNEETSYQELYKHSHANSTYDIMPGVNDHYLRPLTYLCMTAGTKHLNFNDLMFWWSPSMLQCFTALGTRDPLEGYEYAVNAIDEFCSSIHVSKSQYGGSYGTMLSFANESSHQKKL